MFKGNIKKITKENGNFREVLYTGDYSQLVIMSLLPGEEIGEETHHGIDQILFCVEGEGQSVIKGETNPFKEHDVVFVPSDTLHNFINTGEEPMKIYTVYSPPAHPHGTIHKTKEEATKKEEESKIEGEPNDPFENM